MSDLDYVLLNTMMASGVHKILIIEASEPVDTVMARAGDDLEKAKEVYAEEATRLCDALQTHLPGGLFDALLGAMLHAKATVFHVPHTQKS